MSKKLPFTIERTFRSSPAILYEFLTSPSGLVLWFADHVDLNGDIYTFGWNGDEQDAELLVDIEEEIVKLHWVEDDDDRSYFEFRIKKNEITNETILYVTDFAEKEDIRSSVELWESQLDDLAKCIGA